VSDLATARLQLTVWTAAVLVLFGVNLTLGSYLTAFGLFGVLGLCAYVWLLLLRVERAERERNLRREK
jgi:uncharacterized protein (DUF58 family)